MCGVKGTSGNLLMFFLVGNPYKKPMNQGTIRCDAVQRCHPSDTVKTANFIKFQCGELYHPSCDLLEYSLALEVRDPGAVVPKIHPGHEVHNVVGIKRSVMNAR